MLDVEAALARALARGGRDRRPRPPRRSPRRAARSDFDVDAIGARPPPRPATRSAPLVRALRERVGGDAAAHVHRGATSQDILDTAAMLVARRALEPLLADLAGAADGRRRASPRAHRDTPMAGRTLLQQAVPITFGLKAAGWLDRARRGARRARRASATSASPRSSAARPARSRRSATTGRPCSRRYAARARAGRAGAAWHTLRGRLAELAGALGVAAGAVGKVARDVMLLAQTEVGEVRRGRGRGGSSAMPHKRNPVAAVAALALRGAGARAGRDAARRAWCRSTSAPPAPGTPSGGRCSALLASTGSAAAWLRACLEALEVDPARMRANLDATGGRLGGRARWPTRSPPRWGARRRTTASRRSPARPATSPPRSPPTRRSRAVLDRGAIDAPAGPGAPARRRRRVRRPRPGGPRMSTVALHHVAGRARGRAACSSSAPRSAEPRRCGTPQVAGAGRRLPRGPLRPPRPRRLARAARPVRDRRSGRRRARAARRARAPGASTSAGCRSAAWSPCGSAIHAPGARRPARAAAAPPRGSARRELWRDRARDRARAGAGRGRRRRWSSAGSPRPDTPPTPSVAPARGDARRQRRRRATRPAARRSSAWTCAATCPRSPRPTLVIAGADDRATPPDEHAARIAAAIPGRASGDPRAAPRTWPTSSARTRSTDADPGAPADGER